MNIEVRPVHTDHSGATASTRGDEEENTNFCDICFDGLFTDDETNKVMVLNGCDDIYHVECVKEHIATQIEAADFPITCPSHECRKELSASDIKRCLSKEDYDRFVLFEWKWTRDRLPGMTECPNPDCNYYFEASNTPGQEEFDCELCQKKWCLACSEPFHGNYTCDENAAVTAKKYKLVPEKNWIKRIFRKNKRVPVVTAE